ncbi:hypothetical protein ACROYT_G007246 [Oculina patagonica]
MSRPSTSSTLVSRKLSALTESYDGDTESLTCPGAQVENNSVYFNCNESLTSPTFPVKLEGIKPSDTNFTRELSLPSFESDTETETSTSGTSAVNYTDSEFCRVKRPVEKIVESAEICQRNEDCFKSETTTWDNRNDTVDGLSTLLFQSKFISDETPNTNFYDHVRCEANTAEESISGRAMLRENSVMIAENGTENINSSEKFDQRRETERDIKEKQRALRNNFREIVKKGRKVLRETRAKRNRNEISSGRRKAVSKKQTERVKTNNAAAWTNSKKSDTSLENSTKVKDIWIGKRAHGCPKANNLLKQRKRQECLDIEKIQAQHLITELTHWNLHEQATDVERALTFTEEKEKEFDIQLEEERRNIKSLKNAEKLQQRQEEKRKRLEEIRKLEAERKEKEAVDRQRRVEEAKKKRERNLVLWESYHSAVLANSISRSFTFSYFPKLRLQPIERPQTEPQKLTHAAKHHEARRGKYER